MFEEVYGWTTRRFRQDDRVEVLWHAAVAVGLGYYPSLTRHLVDCSVQSIRFYRPSIQGMEKQEHATVPLSMNYARFSDQLPESEVQH